MIGIPIMHYGRSPRPRALNFHLAVLKCPFLHPPNALFSICVWPSMPPLCASFIQNVITLTGSPIYRKKCGLSKHHYLSINLNCSNHQLMTLLIVCILDDTCEITCTWSRCSRHDLGSNNYRKMSSGDQRQPSINWSRIANLHMQKAVRLPIKFNAWHRQTFDCRNWVQFLDTV